VTLDGRVTVVREFSDDPEAVLYRALMQANDGNFYGLSESAIFRLTPEGVLTFVHQFDFITEGTGSLSRGPLVQGPDGHLYGTTVFGGPNGSGTIFRFRLFPDAPAGLTASGPVGTSVRLEWSGQGRTNYVVHRRTSAGTDTVLARGLTTTSFIDSTVVPRVAYTYFVTAVNETGESAPSNQVTVGRQSRAGAAR
jgi:uncharacterized repeat protein (TIGR03803 family)